MILCKANLFLASYCLQKYILFWRKTKIHRKINHKIFFLSPNDFLTGHNIPFFSLSIVSPLLIRCNSVVSPHQV